MAKQSNEEKYAHTFREESSKHKEKQRGIHMKIHTYIQVLLVREVIESNSCLFFMIWLRTCDTEERTHVQEITRGGHLRGGTTRGVGIKREEIK